MITLVALTIGGCAPWTEAAKQRQARDEASDLAAARMVVTQQAEIRGREFVALGTVQGRCDHSPRARSLVSYPFPSSLQEVAYDKFGEQADAIVDVRDWMRYPEDWELKLSDAFGASRPVPQSVCQGTAVHFADHATATAGAK